MRPGRCVQGVTTATDRERCVPLTWQCAASDTKSQSHQVLSHRYLITETLPPPPLSPLLLVAGAETMSLVAGRDHAVNRAPSRLSAACPAALARTTPHARARRHDATVQRCSLRVSVLRSVAVSEQTYHVPTCVRP